MICSSSFALTHNRVYLFSVLVKSVAFSMKNEILICLGIMILFHPNLRALTICRIPSPPIERFSSAEMRAAFGRAGRAVE